MYFDKLGDIFKKNAATYYGTNKIKSVYAKSKININPIQVGAGTKKPATPTSFSPVTFTNVGFGPKIFLTISFNSFATLAQNSKFVPTASLKLLSLNQDHPSKKAIFLVKSL